MSEPCCPPGSLGAPPNLTEKPCGEFLTLEGPQTPCYYAKPPSASKNAILVYPDVWGFKTRILNIADFLAKEGNYHVLICDSMRGETKDEHPDLKPWLEKLPYDPVVAKDTAACVEYLKTNLDVEQIGTLGFCWGGWAIARSYQDGFPWKVAVSCHPSFRLEQFVYGGDDVALMQSLKCPTLLMPASNDPPYCKPGPEFDVLVQYGSRSVVFNDMVHGFTTRGDLSDATVKRNVEAALAEALKFYKIHL
eukprot:Nitzschia sp. Nitz4//scaffold111_size72815//69609//70355//NITZ4_005803-RA/size72815-processed-gene-0.59-mRNA-1//1//CDS//3329533219//4131//frame0